MFRVESAESIRVDPVGNVLVSDMVDGKDGKSTTRLVAMIAPADFLHMYFDDSVEIKPNEEKEDIAKHRVFLQVEGNG